MDFNNDLHREAYEHVKELLTELYGEMYVVADEWPRFMVRQGSAEANILVMPWGDQKAVVEVRAYVVFGPELTPELMKYLLQQNNETVLGGFGIDGDEDVFFTHTLLANDLDKSELRAAISAVLSIADEYDDEIQKRWGGQRAQDRWG